MSTPFIIGLVALLLAVLVAAAIMMQTIEKNNKEKRRLEAALKTRTRDFQHMLEGFPEGFLNKELRLLICRCLQQLYSQLKSLSPKNSVYSNNKNAIDQLSETIKSQAEPSTKVKLTDQNQIKEIQKLLKSLYGYIAKLNKSQKISNDEAKIYSQQIRHLMVQTTLDVLNSGVQDSINKKKPRLAIHYVHMILDKLSKENTQGQYTEQIQQYKMQKTELEKEAIAQEERRKEADVEWDKATEEDTSWKKKALYD